MAKKDKAAKGAVKPGRIPKTIGGVKLSKELRKSGEKLIEKANTPQGRQVIAAGLAMAASAVARAKGPPAPPIPPVPPVPPRAAQSGEGAPPEAPVPPVPPIHPAPDGMGTPMIDPAQIAEAVGQAATAFFDGLFGRRR